MMLAISQAPIPMVETMAATVIGVSPSAGRAIAGPVRVAVIGYEGRRPSRPIERLLALHVGVEVGHFIGVRFPIPN